MPLYRLLLRSIRRTTSSLSTHPHLQPHPSFSLLHPRLLAFSSAEEAAAERRRRKRRLRIEPPLHALRRDPSSPRPPPDPNARPLPDTTSSLTGPRLNLHNRVQSLIRAGDLPNAALLARQSVFSRTRPTVFTCNAIIAAMYRAQRYDDAVSLFQFFFNQSNIVPNIVSYNFLIVSHCECKNVDLGLEVYRHILAEAPFSPSSVTFRHLTKGLIDVGRIEEAVDLLREMLNKGLGADSLVYNNLIKGFLDLDDFDKANEFFDELKERCLVYDGVVNATFMEWFFQRGKGKEAMESYRSLLDRQFKMTPATGNELLEVFLRHEKKKEAWELFDSMLDNHTPPNFQAVNSDTFNIMVNECFREGKYEEAVTTFRKVGIKMKPFAMDVAGYNNIIVRFAEHGMIHKAEEFFNELKSKSLSPDVTGYRTLIDAYLKDQRIDDAMRMFDLMVGANLRVITAYANGWFTELIKNNKVLECSQVLTKMAERDPKPDPSTYEIVIKGLCGEIAFDVSVDLVGQVMKYGVGVTPSLREHLLEAFEKEGRREEIERILDERYWQQFRSQPSGPARSGQPPRPAGSSGFRPSGPSVGYPGPTEPLGSARPADPVRFQGAAGPVGFAAADQARFTGAVRSWGHPTPAGNAGFQGPSAFPAQTGPSAFPAQTGPSSFPAQTGPSAFPAQTGSSAFPAHTGPSAFPAQTGPSGHQEPTRPAEQGGYWATAEPPRFQGTAGPVAYPGQNGDAEFQGSRRPSSYSGNAESTGHPGSTAPVQQRGYPEPNYPFVGRR
ncbi:pentatricopeptide repeat-containing protein At1g10270 isoform X2 [Beta vulgaris subsp. vulgaris]|uniref:pentatricopeptide repeat-containing protein At1g10270 isoform X2 n=1 Tax=Beta vulgaris subsp. vulgaris TaxID=3555 RepID=UPI00203672F3|nr:pentatricopeptide repeat-containing protein At1g10270 isoform X2 [Beta vulgaris subsp. vulgaris]